MRSVEHHPAETISRMVDRLDPPQYPTPYRIPHSKHHNLGHPNDKGPRNNYNAHRISSPFSQGSRETPMFFLSPHASASWSTFARLKEHANADFSKSTLIHLPCPSHGESRPRCSVHRRPQSVSESRDSAAPSRSFQSCARSTEPHAATDLLRPHDSGHSRPFFLRKCCKSRDGRKSPAHSLRQPTPHPRMQE